MQNAAEITSKNKNSKLYKRSDFWNIYKVILFLLLLIFLN